jgi:hypothetical protein
MVCHIELFAVSGERVFFLRFAILIITRVSLFSTRLSTLIGAEKKGREKKVYDEAFPFAGSFTHELLNCASNEMNEVFSPAFALHSRFM